MVSEPSPDSHAPPTREAAAVIDCPRCGFDLRGEVVTWHDECPLRGRCGECGLSFAWCTILGPRFTPRWFLEHPGRRSFRGTRTLVRSLRPWIFWRRIDMSTPVRPTLYSYPLRLLAILLVISAFATAARQAAGFPKAAPSDPVARSAALAAALVVPVLPVPVDVVIERVDPLWTSRAPLFAFPGYRPPSVGARTYASAPLRIWRVLWHELLTIELITLVTCVTAAATFLALPIVRRRARVRWVHIHRVAIYGLAIPIVLAIGSWIADVIEVARLTGTWAVSARLRNGRLDLMWVPPLILGWWWCASRVYLKLERPFATALAVTVVSTLVLILATCVVDPMMVVRLLHIM